MTLERNPFRILGVSARHDRRSIVAAAKQQGLVVDERSVREAKSVLLHPMKRITAEVSWLPSLSSDRITELFSMLRANPIRTRHYFKELPELAQANLMVEAIAYLSADVSVEELARWVVSISVTYDSLALESTIDLINSDRRIAGFPLVARSDAVQVALDHRRRHYRQSIQNVLERRSLSSYTHVLTIAVEDTTSGGRQSPLLIDDLIDRFEHHHGSTLEDGIAQIETLCDRVLQAASDRCSLGIVAARVKQLADSVVAWDELAQPGQVSARSRGLRHSSSIQVARMIRRLAVRLHNEYGMSPISSSLIDLQLEVFAEVDVVVEESEEDAKTLRRILGTHPHDTHARPVHTAGTRGVGGARVRGHRTHSVEQPSRTVKRGEPWPPDPTLETLGELVSQQDSRESQQQAPSCGCLVIAAAVAIAVIFALCGSSGKRVAKSSASTTSPSIVQPQSQTRSESAGIQEQALSKHVAPDGVRSLYSRPSVGRGRRLSLSEIRWCLRQDIRLEAIRSVVSLSSYVDRFNELVRDYNARCASYRYRSGSLSKARSDVGAVRDKIEADAIREFGRW